MLVGTGERITLDLGPMLESPMTVNAERSDRSSLMGERPLLLRLLRGALLPRQEVQDAADHEHDAGNGDETADQREAAPRGPSMPLGQRDVSTGRL